MTRLAGSILFALAFSLSAHAADGVVIGGKDGQNFHEFMETLTKQSFSGSILVANGGKVILANGYGLANREDNIANSPQTVFTFGSITKQFTGAAILKLEMQGKLKTSDKITKFFDNVPKDKQGITLHHLLTHTAGFKSDYADDFDPIRREEYIELMLKARNRTKPGERHRYSNAGYSMLGAIIEKVSGQSYDQYLRDNLFLPTGMKDTGYLLPNWDKSRLAQGYTDTEKWGTLLDKNWDTDGPYWNLRANGGIMSTVLDMYKWHLALMNDTVLNKKARKKLFERHVAEDDSGNWHYGYGWAIATTERGTTLITHNGGNGIFFADFRQYIDEGITFIYATNHADKVTPEMERLIGKQAGKSVV